MKTLIVDDEPLARAYLRRILVTLDEHDIIEAEDAGQALQKAEMNRPDLLFLDIQMPGLSGLQMAAALNSLDSPPLLVFVTGYSEHALAAFEHNALDYVVKPVSRERLTKTLTRARELLAWRAAGKSNPEAASHSRNSETERPGSALSPLTRLPIREDYTVQFIRVEEIVCAVAKEKRVAIRTSDGEKRTYYTLTQLESLLPTERFVRIHNSCIANLEHIQELHSLGSHSYVVRLTDGLQLPVSRSRYPVLQRRLGLGVLQSS